MAKKKNTEEQKREKRKNGEGGLTQKKNGTWQGYVWVPTEKGGKKQKYVTGKTPEEVVRKKKELEAKVEHNIYIEPTKLTVAEWLDIWLKDYKDTDIRSTTWACYETQVRKHIKPSIGYIKLTELQTHHIQKLINEKKTGGRADGRKGGLTPSSIHRLYTVIRASLEQAKLEQKILINPADAVRLPKQIKKDIQFMDLDYAKIFLERAKQSPDSCAFQLALYTGLRRGELLALRWKNVFIPDKDDKNQEGQLYVCENLVNVNKQLIFNEPKTEKSKRYVPIPAKVVPMLRKHLAEQNWKKQLAGKAYNDTDLIFADELGNPLVPRSFCRRFEKMIAELQKEHAGFPKVTFHGLRHTFATLCIEGGEKVHEVQDMLGHSTYNLTMNTYRHASKKKSAKVISAIL